MVGVIRTWDVLSHPLVTIRCFGWRVFFRAVFPWHDATFLGLLREADFFTGAASKTPAFLERCIALEQRARSIYLAFAEVFAEAAPARQFFAALARDEQQHADLLELCRAAAARGRWQENRFNPWQDYLPRLERQMDGVEATLIGSLDDALRLVAQIESSEVNQVFQAVLLASDSAFVRRLRPFRTAMDAHISYIIQRLPELSPGLTLTSRELRARFPQG